VITAVERVGLFDGKDVVGFFNDAQHLVRPRRRHAELTGIDVGQIIASRASPDRSFDFQYGLCELARICGVHFQHKECETLGGFGSDSGELLKLFDEPVYRFCNVHALEHSRNLEAAGQVPQLAVHRLLDFSNAFVDGCDDKVL